MQVNYNKLFNLLKRNNMTQKNFRDNVGITGGTMANFIHNKSVTVATICRICDYFHCMPDDIMDWIPEPDPTEKENEKQKAELRSQIEALQKQLDNL